MRPNTAHTMTSVADAPSKVGKINKFLRWPNPFRGAFKRGASVEIERSAPDGVRVYCVGDVHGRDDLLREMGGRVEVDLENRSFDQAVTVFLGDYIDRGLGSMRVVEQLARGEWPTRIIPLAGNHEHLLLGFLEDAAALEDWRSFGGLETLYSYGVNVGSAMAGRDFEVVQREFVARFPESHRHFLRSLEVCTTIGDYFFCHAGVRPGVPLDRQRREDLLTIRAAFLSSQVEHGKLVVHGHTPSVDPEVRANRIGIDTAAFATNRLTCLVLERRQRRFLQAGMEQSVT
jgi:serine/threonine protein phosphatase 1